jgi:hypothetical protein
MWFIFKPAQKIVNFYGSYKKKMDEGSTVLYSQSIHERRPSSCAAGVLLRHIVLHSVENLKGRERMVMQVEGSAAEQNANSGLAVRPRYMRQGERLVHLKLRKLRV